VGNANFFLDLGVERGYFAYVGNVHIGGQMEKREAGSAAVATGMEPMVVFGSGPVGQAVARELLARGLRVKMLSRTGRLPEGYRASLGSEALARIDLARVDALDRASVLAVCQGAKAIYHCINTPYQDWAKTLRPIQDNIVEAALAAHAVLAVADNLYMYSRGLDSINEESPRIPPSRKGRLREVLHAALLDAAANRGLRFVSVRASDFYGPGATWQSVFGTERFLDPLFAGKAPALLGDPDQVHSFSFVEDFGRGLVLASLEPSSLGRAWILPHAPALTSRETAILFAKEAGSAVQPSRIPRLALSMLGLFNPLVRELGEILYQKEEPYLVDGSRFASAFKFAPTSLEEGVRRTIAWYRSIPASKAS
jgi:nucleoside-diphosphate-sugar epimerase